MQPDIFNILLRFRLHRIALTADVEKMYRQLLVSEDDCDLQRIVYRSQPEELLRHYKLKTVTYGTKSVSFLATRCLHELGAPIENTLIGRIICQDFYVDDLISGGDTDEKCFDIHKQVHSILGTAGFLLRKWCSSSSTLLNSHPYNQKDPNFMINLTETEVLSVLGLLWQPSMDSFRFAMKNWNAPQHIMLISKIFIQQVWSLKVGWDDILSEEIRSKWLKFYSSLVAINGLIIPRLALLLESDSYELRGFCDSSFFQHAYGACIYIRSSKQGDDAKAKLFTARSRVAPIKTTTIPRLVLCGALLLSELVKEIKDEFSNINMKLSTENIHLWTDSTIVLAWLNSLKPFQVYVANRVAQINELSYEIQWHHTSTADNHADLISRGVDVETGLIRAMVARSKKWTKKERSCWPDTPILPSEIPEMSKVKLILATTNKEPFWLFEKCSTWSKLLRTTALIQRFVSNCKAQRLKHERHNGFISVDEINKARRFWLMQAQSESMSNEIADLSSGKMVHRGSCLKALNPFIDDQGLIKVEGRLAYAPGQYNTKHTIVLPSKSLITKLIFIYEHIWL